MLYGADLAKREIAQRRQAVIVEGYTDVMACHLAGVPTAVATSGTSFGEGHIKVLRRLLMDADRFRGEVIFTFDGDAAGQRAALRAFDLEERFVTQTFVAVQPDGLDPCDLRLKHGDAAVRDLVAQRVPLFEFAIRSELAQAQPGHQRGPAGRAGRRGPDHRPDQGPRPARPLRGQPGPLARHAERGVRAGPGPRARDRSGRRRRRRRRPGPGGQPRPRRQSIRDGGPGRRAARAARQPGPRPARRPGRSPVRPGRPGDPGGAGGAQAGHPAAGAVRARVRRHRPGRLHRAAARRGQGAGRRLRRHRRGGQRPAVGGIAAGARPRRTGPAPS